MLGYDWWHKRLCLRIFFSSSSQQAKVTHTGTLFALPWHATQSMSGMHLNYSRISRKSGCQRTATPPPNKPIRWSICGVFNCACVCVKIEKALMCLAVTLSYWVPNLTPTLPAYAGQRSLFGVYELSVHSFLFHVIIEIWLSPAHDVLEIVT